MAHRQALFKLQKPSSVGWLARVSRSAKFDLYPLHGEVEQGGLTSLPSEAAQKRTLDISNISSAVWHPWSPLLRRGGADVAGDFAENVDWRLSEEQVAQLQVLRSLKGLLGEATFEKLQFPAPQAHVPMEADSVKRKRRKKMNKHKQRKLRRRERNKSQSSK